MGFECQENLINFDNNIDNLGTIKHHSVFKNSMECIQGLITVISKRILAKI